MRLDKNKFETWLKARPAAEIVGENKNCHGCPIARFYHKTSGGCEIVIFDRGDGYSIDRGYSIRPLPPWASRFVFHIDGDANGKISAGRALEVLDRFVNSPLG